MNLSVRSLQRRLAAEGTLFEALLDETRAELAKRYLRAGALGVTQVAYQLGFSDPANFTRAFKRWTGRTPRDFAARRR